MASGGQVFSGFTIEPLKEPRGFIKPIQWVLSIFAFATMTGVTLTMQFVAECPKGNDTFARTFQMSAKYPYALEDVGMGANYVCNSSHPQSQNLLQGSQSPAQFYVFVGVIVFLYCLAALVLYLFCEEFYKSRNAVPIADFIISGVIVLLWLISSSAWAQGVADLKYYTDLFECGYFKYLPDCAVAKCRQIESPNFASLNVSIIFGFLNMLVWGGNMWFLFKETSWHKDRTPQAPPMGSVPEGAGRI